MICIGFPCLRVYKLYGTLASRSYLTVVHTVPRRTAPRLPWGLPEMHLPPPTRRKVLESLPPSVSLALKPYPCRKGRTRCRSRWSHVLQAALSKRCSPSWRMWHWHLRQHRPTSPSGRRDDPVDHSAMSSRQATRIHMSVSSLRTLTTWQPPSAAYWWWWCQLHRDRRRRHLCCQLSPHTPYWTCIEDGRGHACYVCSSSLPLDLVGDCS